MHCEQGSRVLTSYKGFDGLITHRMLSKGCLALSAFLTCLQVYFCVWADCGQFST